MQSLLLTGATGFLGRNILPQLRAKFSHVARLSRSADCEICCDLAAEVPVLLSRFDVVVHAAGKAHTLPVCEAEVQEYFDVNVSGTRNLCAALEKSGVPSALVFISTVAVYGCESGLMIDESNPLNGSTPYAQSKIQAEELLRDWCARHSVVLTILRPALIAAPDAPANLGDMIRGIRSGRYADIAGTSAQRSLVAAADFAEIIPRIAQIGGTYNVSYPQGISYRTLSTMIAEALGKRAPRTIPLRLARLLAAAGDAVNALPSPLKRHLPKPPITTPRLRKFTAPLTFSSEKLLATLPDFHPSLITPALLLSECSDLNVKN
ncbi:MAG: NAD-dependent epimerase/dehydratase family protein [Bacteroidales bacterium]|nr:NAD-dependent epimerase/dehydratase family protein [Bacteroidales bacterium]